MIAFITGGTGLLGSHLLPLLATRFDRVRLLVRKRPDEEYPRQVEFIHGSLDSETEINGALDGCQAFFHLAACVTRWEKDSRTYDRVNVEGFRRVMDLASRHNVGQVVYTSTFFALGASGERLLDEASKPIPGQWFTHYDRTKIAADSLVPIYRAKGLAIKRVYPGVIYGPGPMTQGNIVVHLIRDFLSGKVPGLLGGGGQHWSFAYVKDVARGIVDVLEKGDPGDDFVLGGDNRSLREFFEFVARRFGKRPPRYTVPLWVGMVWGAINDLVATTTGREPALTRGMVRAMCHDWACSSAKASRKLGYQPRRLEEGLDETIRWLTSQHLDAGRYVPDRTS